MGFSVGAAIDDASVGSGAGRSAESSQTGNKVGAESTHLTRHSHGMEFAPAIDPRLRASVGRIVDLHSSAAIWRELRRRARLFQTTTPCYESVRKLVVAERERRARLLATIATVLEIAACRGRVLPEHVELIYRRRRAEFRARLGLRGRPPP